MGGDSRTPHTRVCTHPPWRVHTHNAELMYARALLEHTQYLGGFLSSPVLLLQRDDLLVLLLDEHTGLVERLLRTNVQ